MPEERRLTRRQDTVNNILLIVGSFLLTGTLGLVGYLLTEDRQIDHQLHARLIKKIDTLEDKVANLEGREAANRYLTRGVTK